MKRTLFILLSALAFNASANEGGAIQQIEVSKDLASLERGVDTVTSVCTGCHSLKYIHYSDLLNMGMSKEKVNALRGDQPMDAHLSAQMDADSLNASFGMIPPDLSLMAKAREGGPSYVYSFLLGFHSNAQGEQENSAFPGGKTKMPDVLAVDGADVAAKAEAQAKAHDVASFLSWAADPRAEERTTLGKYTLIYLAVLTVLLYLMKKRIWARLD